MFDTMKMTKIVGGLCGALLIFLLIVWAGDVIYGGGEGHGGEDAEHAFNIAPEGTGETDAGTEPAAPVDIAPLMAAADVAAGENIFSKCKGCHKLDSGKGAGPALNGVIGRDIASFPDFAYTEALSELAGNWDPQTFSEFLTDPKAFAPGTKMNIKIAKPEDRANLIAYLESVGG